MRKKVLLIGFLITLFLFLSILAIGAIMDSKRQDNIDLQFEGMYKDINDIQQMTLMSEVYGQSMACIAFKTKLQELDKKVWNMGIKLEQYRVASEEFQKNPYYLDQKKTFNENELTYMTILTKIKSTCEYHQPVISFFYKNADECQKCDSQSFVLTDVNEQLKENVSIFSFDMDLNISTLNLMTEYYKIDQYPCIVIDEVPYCGIRDKNFILKKICEDENISGCSEILK